MMKQGFEFMEADTSIYNLLVRKQQEGDDILSLFRISYINDNYSDRDAEEVNTIYVLRDEMTVEDDLCSFDCDGYKVLVQVIINTSQYDVIKASALLKTAVHTIKQYILLENLEQFVSINKVVPTYTSPGRLSQFRLELLCYEIDEFLPVVDHDWKLWLKVKAGIRGTKEGVLEEIFPVQTCSELLPEVNDEEVVTKHRRKIK